MRTTDEPHTEQRPRTAGRPLARRDSAGLVTAVFLRHLMQ